MGYNPWGPKESDVTEGITHIHIYVNVYIYVYVNKYFRFFSLIDNYKILNTVLCSK